MMALRFDTPYTLGEDEQPPCPSAHCDCPDCSEPVDETEATGGSCRPPTDDALTRSTSHVYTKHSARSHLCRRRTVGA
jgi:hypothetical protein